MIRLTLLLSLCFQVSFSTKTNTSLGKIFYCIVHLSYINDPVVDCFFGLVGCAVYQRFYSSPANSRTHNQKRSCIYSSFSSAAGSPMKRNKTSNTIVEIPATIKIPFGDICTDVKFKSASQK